MLIVLALIVNDFYILNSITSPSWMIYSFPSVAILGAPCSENWLYRIRDI